MEFKATKTRGPMYVLSPFLLYVAGVVVVELVLALLFLGFSFLSERSGLTVLISIDHFLFNNEELIIPAVAGLIKIPHFLKDFYREDWEYRVEAKPALGGQYRFNMEEAKAWAGIKGLLSSFGRIAGPGLIVALSLSTAIFFNFLTGHIASALHMRLMAVDIISDVGGVGGPGSALELMGGHTSLGKLSPLMLIFSTIIAAPLIEELVFRGVLFQRLRDNHGFMFSAALSSAAFGIIHFNLLQGIFGFFMGMIFAFIYERQHRLSASVLAHMSVNILEALMLVPGLAPVYEVINSSAVISLAVMLSAGALGIIFLAVMKKSMPGKEYIVFSHLKDAGMQGGK